jgi:hypothetical protein
VRVGGVPYLVYHAWQAPHVCSDGGSRKLMLDRIRWSGGWPTVANGTPSRTAQPAPSIP